MTKYGSLLREFDLSQLKSIFGNIELPESEVEAVFDQSIHRCYIVPRKERNKYAIHELFRTVLGQYVREQERSLWGGYHKRYLDFFQFQTDPAKLSFSTDWHYHNLGFRLALDENEESARRYWTETLAFLLKQGVAPAPLVEAACDKTLMFTSVANKAQQYKQRNP